jgi:hypothetical protein
MGIRTVGVVLAVVLPAAAAEAGEAYGANRVRLTLQRAESGGSHRIVGELVARDADTLTVRDPEGREAVVRQSEVLKLERSLGRRSRAGGALRCAAIGFGAGAVVGAAAGALSGDEILFGERSAPREFGAYLGGVGAAFGGALCAWGPGERWQSGSPRGPAIGVRPSRSGLGLEAGIGF